MPATEYDRHAAGSARVAALVGLISADHPQLWTRDRLITRAAEHLRETTTLPWEVCCARAERLYDGWDDLTRATPNRHDS
jgi:hypothetical protein